MSNSELISQQPEFLKMYPTSQEWFLIEDIEKGVERLILGRPQYPFFSRVGDSKNTDYIVYFKSEKDMIDFDNYQEFFADASMRDRGFNLYKRIKEINNDLPFITNDCKI